jgi:flagellar hook-length control protein FliK
MKVGNVDSLDMIKATTSKVNNINKKDIITSEKADNKENKFEKLLKNNMDNTQKKTPLKEEKLKDDSESLIQVAEEKVVLETDKIEEDSQVPVDISLLLKLIPLLKEDGKEEITLDRLQELTGSTDMSSMKALVNMLTNVSDGLSEKNISVKEISPNENKVSNELLKLLVKDEKFLVIPKELKAHIEALVEQYAKEPISEQTKLAAILNKTNSDKVNVVDQPKDINKGIDEDINESVENSSPKLADLVEGKKEVTQSKPQSSLENGTQDSFKEADTKEDKLLKSIINSDSKGENKLISLTSHLSRIADSNVQVNDISQTLVVNKNTMANDVVKVIKYMDLNNLKELTVKMNPKDLGEITIKVSMEGTLLKANISASNKDTYNLLNSNVLDMKNSLNNSQIKVQEVAINIYNGDTTFFSNNFNSNGQQFGRQSRGDNNSGDSIKITEVENIDSETTNYDKDGNLSVLA